MQEVVDEVSYRRNRSPAGMSETITIPECPVCGKVHAVVIDATYQIAFAAPKSNKPYEETHRILITCPEKGATFTIVQSFRGKVVAVEVKSVTTVKG